MPKKQKYTATQVIKALKESKGMVYVAAGKLGCSHTTVYNYADRYPTVQQAIEESRGLMIDKAEMALWNAVENGEAWAVSLTLKTVGKHRGYVERQEYTGPDGKQITLKVEYAEDPAGNS